MIITTEPNELVRPIHNRMPVILGPADYSAWLSSDTDLADLEAMLKPYPAELMQEWRVLTAVNKATVEGPELVQPVTGV